MTGKEILTKAIEKAIAGGWTQALRFAVRNDGQLIELYEKGQPGAFVYTPEQIIFSHDFAKALWGEGDRFEGRYFVKSLNGYIDLTAWQYHLQQMVIAEDPIKYLGDNL